MSLFNKTTTTDTTTDDEVPEHLAPFYDHPDDEDDLLARYTDRTAEADWHRETSFARERDRLVAAGEMRADMPWREAKARIKATTDFQVPPLTPEDRQAYRHAVRLGFAQRRHDDAERGRQMEQNRVQNEQCTTGHRDPTTMPRSIHGTINARLCDGCAIVADQTVAAILAAENIDGTPRGDRVRVWLATVEDQLHHQDPSARAAWTIAYSSAMAAGRVPR